MKFFQKCKFDFGIFFNFVLEPKIRRAEIEVKRGKRGKMWLEIWYWHGFLLILRLDKLKIELWINKN